MANHPLLLGHRGVRAEKSLPENSLASFDLALAQGCDGFEFDVRLSADGRAVVCHDAISHGQEVASCSAKQLSLPSLREVLTRYQTRAFLDIELKVPGLEKITVDLLRKVRPVRGFGPCRAVRRAGRNQHVGQSAADPGQGHDLAVHLLRRLVDGLAGLWRRHDAGADAAAAAHGAGIDEYRGRARLRVGLSLLAMSVLWR